MTAHDDPAIARDDEAGRYVLEAAPAAAFLEFEASDHRLRLVHTEVADQREGEGLGSALVRTALADAEQRGLAVVPECDFVKGWLERHPDRADELTILSASGDRGGD